MTQNQPVLLTYSRAKQAIRAAANQERARFLEDFFRTGRGGYGEGDRFLGLTVPETRSISRVFRELPFPDVIRLLHSEFHEERLMALAILVLRFERASPRKDEKTRAKIFKLYLANRKYVNNWDLVDMSAGHIFGAFLLTQKNQKILDTLSRSKGLWDRRIAMVATFAMIRANRLEWTFKLAERFLTAPEDLMHKASGWMLREAGKRDEKALRKFLDANAAVMPRTMLRYALEKLPIMDRKRYMSKRAEAIASGLLSNSSRTLRTRR